MRILTGLLTIVLFFGIVSCDSIFNDQPATPEEEIDPPEFPPFGVIEYDFGALGDIAPGEAEIPTPAYDELEDPHQLLSAVLARLMYEVKNEVEPPVENVLNPVEIDDGEFELDAFKWEYELNTEFYSDITINSPAELSAKVREDGSVDWELVILDTDDNDDEFLLLEGSNNQDNTRIRWTLYDPENAIEIELAELAYTMMGNLATQVRLSTEFDPQEPLPGNIINFELDDDEAQVTFNNKEDEQNFTAFYDYEEGDGTINYVRGDDGKEYCWNSDFEIVDCE